MILMYSTGILWYYIKANVKRLLIGQQPAKHVADGLYCEICMVQNGKILKMTEKVPPADQRRKRE